MSIKKELSKLTEVDIYSVVMFALFKLKDIPEYSTLSELAYIVDKDSLLKMCEYFGGMTIRIPKVEELEQVVYALTLYQYINIDNMDYAVASRLLDVNSSKLREIKIMYIKICDILDNYSFSPRGDT